MYQGGTPDFKWWGWWNGGKNQNQKKIPRASKETPEKSLDQNLSPQKSLAEFPRQEFPENFKWYNMKRET